MSERVTYGLVLVGLALVLGLFATTAIGRHLEAISRIQSGDILLAEGIVANTRCIGKGRQAFTVGRESFEPSDVDFQPGFESGRAFSNSVLNGMHVRIRYFDASWGVRIVTKLENDAATGISAPGAKLLGPCG